MTEAASPTSSSRAGALVTPLVLTYNEEHNIGRTLAALAWARRVVVLDSGSSDRTRAIAQGFPNVSWHVRPFDSHAQQWRFGIADTDIDTQYVLALDADYRVTDAFVDELAGPFADGQFAGGVAAFDYHVFGQALVGSVYPAKLVVFDRKRVNVTQPGHSQEMQVEGAVYRFKAHLIHDDRKPVDRFIRSQTEYSRLEVGRLAGATHLRWQDHVRRRGWMPLIAGLAAYCRAGGPWRGRAALRYAYERAAFECLLAMRVLEDNGRRDRSSAP